MKQSKLFSVGFRDFVKGLIMAVISAVLVVIQETVSNGSLSFHWQTIGKIALLTAITYITKNWLTNSKDHFMTKEPE